MKLSIENSKNFRPREKFCNAVFKLENDYKKEKHPSLVILLMRIGLEIQK